MNNEKYLQHIPILNMDNDNEGTGNGKGSK